MLMNANLLGAILLIGCLQIGCQHSKSEYRFVERSNTFPIAIALPTHTQNTLQIIRPAWNDICILKCEADGVEIAPIVSFGDGPTGILTSTVERNTWVIRSLPVFGTDQSWAYEQYHRDLAASRTSSITSIPECHVIVATNPSGLKCSYEIPQSAKSLRIQYRPVMVDRVSSNTYVYEWKEF